MNVKLLNYDIVEYKALEEKLNEYNNEGWNLKKFGLLPQFVKDDRKYHYIVDVIMTKQKKTKYKMLQELLDSYEKINYHYVGHRNGMVVLRSEVKRNKPKEREGIVSAYLKTKVIPAYIMLVIAVVFGIFAINYVFDNESVVSFMTNGKIILHYFPIAIALYCIMYTLFTLSLRLGKFNKEEEFKKIHQSKLVLLALIPLLIFSFVLGCILDATGSKTYELDHHVLTLEELGFKKAIAPDNTYQHSSSFVLDAYTTYQSNGEISLYQLNFDFENSEKTNKYYEQYMKSILRNNKDVQKVDENTYLIKEFDFYNAVVVKCEQSFTYISTTIDIESHNLLDKIIENYKHDNK